MLDSIPVGVLIEFELAPVFRYRVGMAPRFKEIIVIRRQFLMNAGAAALTTAVGMAVPKSTFTQQPAGHLSNSEAKRRAWMRTAFQNHVGCPHCPAVHGMLLTGFFRDSVYYLLQSIGWTASDGEHPYAPVNVSEHFVTDLASIPPAFYEYLTPTGTYAYAAVVHDWLYWQQDRPKEEADEILLLIMKEFDVRADQAWSIHTAVSKWGDHAWRSNAQLKASGEGRILDKLPTDPKTNWSDWRKDHSHFADSNRRTGKG